MRNRPVKGSREPAGRSIHEDEFIALITACVADENEALGIRDAALLAVLKSTGIRRAEAAGAVIEGYDAAERSLRVIGKGNKQRAVYLHKGASLTWIHGWSWSAPGAARSSGRSTGGATSAPPPCRPVRSATS